MRRLLIIDRNPGMAESVRCALDGYFDVLDVEPPQAHFLVEMLQFDLLLCEWNLGATPAQPILEAALARSHRPRVWIAYERRPEVEATRYAAERGLALLSKPFRSLGLAALVA